MKPPSFDPNASRLGRRLLDTIERALSTVGLVPSGDVTVTGAPGTDPGARSPGAARPGRVVSYVFSNAAGSRVYKVYRPSGAAPGLRPVVVMLHGCTQSADDFAAGTQINRLADRHGFIAVYPEQGSGANASKCWNWFSSENQQRGCGEPSLIAGITREVIEREGGDPKRVFVAGLSAGGAMAVIMAETYPDLYAAAGVHSGLPYASAHDVMSALSVMQGGVVGEAAFVPAAGVRAVPVIVFHGDSDPMVHPSNGIEIVARAGKAHAAQADAPMLRPVSSRGTSGGGREYTRTVHACDEGHARIEAWILHGAGHAWSGGHASGSHTDASGPDASAEMVRFFLSLPVDTPSPTTA